MAYDILYYQSIIPVKQLSAERQEKIIKLKLKE